VKILTIADRHIEYAKEVEKELLKAKVRVDIDSRSEKIGYKIREAQLMKIPYMLIIGDKEVEDGMVGVRSRSDGDLGSMRLKDFKEKIVSEIENYK
jgi:threonyl-tRNA synthetase